MKTPVSHVVRLFLPILLFTVLCAGCKSDKSLLVGKWQSPGSSSSIEAYHALSGHNPKPDNLSMQFFSDGTFDNSGTGGHYSIATKDGVKILSLDYGIGVETHHVAELTKDRFVLEEGANGKSDPQVWTRAH